MATHTHDGSELSPIELRVRALESILTEKGYVDPAAIDALVETYETKIGPRNGARVVAKAWTDPEFRAWLLGDATAAIASLGFAGRQGEHMIALENTPNVHHLVVCTLCSCYPWTVLGLPPIWYKSPPYRSRAVLDPRGVLAEFGVTLPETTHIRVWDSTACHPRLHDRNWLGGQPRNGGCLMNGAQDLGGMMGFGPVEPEPNEPWFHADWERRAFGLTLAMGATGTWNIDMGRHARESLHPADYLMSSYYEIWTKGLEKQVVANGLLSTEELSCGHALSAPAPVKRVLHANEVAAGLRRGGPADRPAEAPARFALGDSVSTRTMNPSGHTRLPRYARSKRGVIEAVRGVFVFPDTNAHGRGECPQWLYTVAFSGQELWGPEADPSIVVSIDAWESYLEPA